MTDVPFCTSDFSFDAALEYSLREPLRLIAPESEFFAAPAPLRPETNVGQHSPPAVKPNAVSRFREDVTTPSSVDPLPAADVDPYELAERESTGQFSATHPNRWEENPTGDGRGALSHVFETDDDQSHNAPSSLQAAAAGSQMGGMDTFWAISRVGEEDYCPPTMASRLATGTICCLVLLRPQLIPVQIIIACLASAVTGMFAPTYEDVRAYEQRRANQLAEHRAGIESRERR